MSLPTKTTSTQWESKNNGAKDSTGLLGDTWNYGSEAVKNLIEGKIYKTLTLLALSGYIVIAFSGHLANWADFLRYVIFIVFCSVVSLTLYSASVKSSNNNHFFEELVISITIKRILFVVGVLFLLLAIYYLVVDDFFCSELGNNKERCMYLRSFSVGCLFIVLALVTTLYQKIARHKNDF